MLIHLYENQTARTTDKSNSLWQVFTSRKIIVTDVCEQTEKHNNRYLLMKLPFYRTDPVL